MCSLQIPCFKRGYSKKARHILINSACTLEKNLQGKKWQVNIFGIYLKINKNCVQQKSALTRN